MSAALPTRWRLFGTPPIAAFRTGQRVPLFTLIGNNNLSRNICRFSTSSSEMLFKPQQGQVNSSKKKFLEILVMSFFILNAPKNDIYGSIGEIWRKGKDK